MKVLFIFLDGVGLGDDNPEVNPFAHTSMPNLEVLLDKHKLVADGRARDRHHKETLVETRYASLLALDACLGVEGTPQSATGQATLLTGINVPAILGFHEGPKPTPPIYNLIKKGTILSALAKRGKSVALVNAFPPRYFENIQAGYRIPGVIALSTQQAGFNLKTATDLLNGNAISADFTAEGWRTHLSLQDTPVINHHQAGERLARLANETDLTIFEYWLTDVAGHHQDMQTAGSLLNALDEVIGSLIQSWDIGRGLIVLTSDHGNLEDLSTRHHTTNDVPLLIIGSLEQRKAFISEVNNAQTSSSRLELTNFGPAISNYLR